MYINIIHIFCFFLLLNFDNIRRNIKLNFPHTSHVLNPDQTSYLSIFIPVSIVPKLGYCYFFQNVFAVLRIRLTIIQGYTMVQPNIRKALEVRISLTPPCNKLLNRINEKVDKRIDDIG